MIKTLIFVFVISQYIANLTSQDYNEAVRLMINDSYTQDLSYYGPHFAGYEGDGTAHLSLLGPGGAAVSLTSTINL